MTANETGRVIPGNILGSAPIDDALEALPSPTFAPLTFDPAEFLQFVVHENLTEAQATALLTAIWEIVVAFVDLGFGIHPVQQALVGRSNGSDGSRGNSASAVLGSILQSEFNKHMQSAHATRDAEAEEDS